jgi:hypothetical protein
LTNHTLTTSNGQLYRNAKSDVFGHLKKNGEGVVSKIILHSLFNLISYLKNMLSNKYFFKQKL